VAVIGSHGNKWLLSLLLVSNEFRNIVIGCHGNKWLCVLSLVVNSFAI
jgi:hypothetical protein